MGNVRRYEKDLLINCDSAAEQAAYQPKWAASLELSRAKARHLSGDANPALAAVATKVDQLLASYQASATPVLHQVAIGGFNDAPVANKAMAPTKVFAHEADQQVSRLGELLDQDGAASVTDRQAARRWATFGFAAAVIAALVLVVPLTLLNMRSICDPIAAAQALAEKITAGDLSQPVVVQGQDESAHLLRSLAAMQDSLRGIVGQVRQSSESIQAASAEVAAGNTDLSHRTEQTASGLQQTASSMVQLTNSVRHSADAASQAQQLATSAQAVAQRGGLVVGQVVGQVVATMDQINHSSKRIADIIGTIDGIAFQTNTLALNAAVEAARAGGQGCGFAVVASEVRSLAQRSAEAAREIKTLIGASVERVDVGARLVQDAGSTMGEIVVSVQRVTNVIGEITTASAEQSQGIGSVNNTITSLDQMTQQNAALVEQSAAAAESLRDQAGRLLDVVARFRLAA